MNAVIGSFSVLSMYLVAHRLFGWFTAVLASTALAFLPLHVGMSASSYTEAPFVTIILLSFFALTKAASTKIENKANHPAWLCITIASMIAANMIRCESWLYLPLWIGFNFWRTRNVASRAVLTTALSIFPLVWLYGCWVDYRMPLVSFSTTTDPRNRVLNLLDASVAFATILFRQLGPLVPLAAVCGLIAQARSIFRKHIQAGWQDRAFYVVWVSLIIAMNVGLTITSETDDGADLNALVQIAVFRLEKDPLYEKDDVHVYRIIPGTFKAKPNQKLPPCFWYPAPNWRTFNQPWKRKSGQ